MKSFADELHTRRLSLVLGVHSLSTDEIKKIYARFHR